MRKLLLSLFSGATIAFVLLILMAQLVAFRGERPTAKPPKVVDTFTPERKTEPLPPKKQLPEQPKPAVAPAPTGISTPLEPNPVARPVTVIPETPTTTRLPIDWLPTGFGEQMPTHGKDGVLRAIRQLQPMYPIDARERGIEGQVTLRFVVDARGLVNDIEVLDSQPRGVFEKAARMAVSRWQYENPEQKPVSQTVTLSFALEQP